MEYTETHRVLLTLLRTCKYISHSNLVESFKTIVERLEPQEPTTSYDNLLNAHVSAINYRISQHGFKVDKKTNEATGELTYIFVNTISDEVIKQNTDYSAKELEVIKHLVDGIMENEDLCMGRVNAQQTIALETGRTLGEASRFVELLVDLGWFNMTSDERLVLSPRAVAELKNYLISRYGVASDGGKVFICKQCNEIVTMGVFLKDLHQPFHWKCYAIYVPGGEADVTIGVPRDTIIE